MRSCCTTYPATRYTARCVASCRAAPHSSMHGQLAILTRERVRLRDSRDSRASRDFHGPCHDPRDSRDSRVPCVLRKKEKTPENRKIQEQAVHDKCHATGSCKNAMRASLHADALGRKEGGELTLAPGHAASKTNSLELPYSGDVCANLGDLPHYAGKR